MNQFKSLISWIVVALLLGGTVTAVAMFIPEEKTDVNTIKVVPCSYHYNSTSHTIVIIYPNKKKLSLISTPQDDAYTYGNFDNYAKAAAILDLSVFNLDTIALETFMYNEETCIKSIVWHGTRYQLSK